MEDEMDADRPGGRATRHGHVLLDEVARGPGGAVHRAHPEGRPGRVVALRWLAGADATAAGRLAETTRRLRALAHPAVVAPEEVRVDGDGVALVLPWPGGGVAVPGTWSAAAVRERGVALADGLAALHADGLVHGHVVPANVVVDARGRAALADAGLGVATGRVVGVTAADDARALARTLGALAVPGDDAGLEATLARVVAAPDARAADVAAACAPPVPGVVARGPSPARLPAPDDLDGDATLAATALDGLALLAEPVPSRPRLGQQVLLGCAVGGVVGLLAAGALAIAGVGGDDRSGSAPGGADAPTTTPVVATWPAVWCDGVAVPDLPGVRAADVDGRGCALPVVVEQADVGGVATTVLRLPEAAGELAGRWAAGPAGATVVLGDWDGDGVDTPGVVRPDGEVFTWDAWRARAGADAAGTAEGAVRVVADGSVDRVAGG